MARFFIDRPIFAWVLAILVMLGGTLAIFQLPLAQYPSIAPPQIRLSATYTGASAKTMEDSVTQVIEQQMTGLDGLTYMSSSSSSAGSASITLTFDAGTDINTAQMQVQTKLEQAKARLPDEVQQQGIEIRNSSSDFLIILSLVSDNPEVGATDISYDDPSFDDHLLATAMVDVDWNITRLTTISVTAERAPQATTQPGSSVRIDNSLDVSVTHELRRSLLVELDAGYAKWNFKGIDRKDDVTTVGAGVTYLMNRYIHLVAEYRYYDRSSDFELADFSRHQASIGLKLQL